MMALQENVLKSVIVPEDCTHDAPYPQTLADAGVHMQIRYVTTATHRKKVTDTHDYIVVLTKNQRKFTYTYRDALPLDTRYKGWPAPPIYIYEPLKALLNDIKSPDSLYRDMLVCTLGFEMIELLLKAEENGELAGGWWRNEKMY